MRGDVSETNGNLNSLSAGATKVVPCFAYNWEGGSIHPEKKVPRNVQNKYFEP